MGIHEMKTGAGIAGRLVMVGLLFLSGAAQASMQLQSSVVVIEAAEGEGVISLENTSESPVLLHSTVVDIEEDSESLLLVTPPITRVDPGDTQMVRFILKPGEGRPVERLRRAAFEGIPQVKPGVVTLSIRQNIPIIIRPKGLQPNSEPWTLLKWSRSAGGVSVKNDSPYVVRMSPNLKVGAAGTAASLPKTYILPGESLDVPVAEPLLDARHVTFRPATINGYLVADVQAELAAP